MKQLFTDSAACGLRVHCATCRNLAGGRLWRGKLRRGFALPGDETDFACPHGGDWGEPPDPLRDGVRPHGEVRLPAIRRGCCGGGTSPADVQRELLRQSGAIA